jgi:cystathionine beta-lyase
MELACPFDFDTPVSRRGTDSMKWSVPDDMLPLPVADMDFAAPAPVLAAVRRRLDHGVLGYAGPTREAQEAIVAALERDFAWKIDPSWLVFEPGVVPMLQYAVRMLEPGETPVTFTPIYPPFIYRTVLSGRSQTRVPLAASRGTYEIDWDALDRLTRDPAIRLFLGCNPQNPTGRCFPRADLEKLADFCLRRNLLIASDEIHCELVLDASCAHVPMASLSPEVAARTMTFMSPSKTYNIPGLCTAFAVISDPELRRRFRAQEAGLLPPVNVLGYAACAAAYRECAPWREALLEVLRRNCALVTQAVRGIRGLQMNAVEATYLAWIDCRELGVEDPAAFFRKGGVELSDGKHFDGPGFVRLNFGCPLSTLEEALARMRRAVETLWGK